MPYIFFPAGSYDMNSAAGQGQRLRLRLATAAGLSLAAFAAAPLSAQMLAPKALGGPAEVIQACPAMPAPALVSAASAGAVDSLLAAGTRATILGDNYTAGELLRQAAALDPGNPVIAYRLGRIYEERGEADLAVDEYCRYLRVAPRASEAADVGDRVQRLAASAAEGTAEEFEAAARAGLRAYEQRRYQAAVLAYSRALEMRGGWASGYFNRGLSYAAARYDQAAIADLQRYLELNPSAEDRAAVETHIEQLRSGTAPRAPRLPSPGGVFARGLVVPGLGQFATSRPFGGLLVLAGTAGAAYWAMQEESVVGTETALDPFGNPYQIQVRSLERPNLATGLGIAAGLALAGAAEAYLYARRQREPPLQAGTLATNQAPRVKPHLAESSDRRRVEVGLSIALPNGR